MSRTPLKDRPIGHVRPVLERPFIARPVAAGLHSALGSVLDAYQFHEVPLVRRLGSDQGALVVLVANHWPLELRIALWPVAREDRGKRGLQRMRAHYFTLAMRHIPARVHLLSARAMGHHRFRRVVLELSKVPDRALTFIWLPLD